MRTNRIAEKQVTLNSAKLMKAVKSFIKKVYQQKVKKKEVKIPDISCVLEPKTI